MSRKRPACVSLSHSDGETQDLLDRMRILPEANSGREPGAPSGHQRGRAYEPWISNTPSTGALRYRGLANRDAACRPASERRDRPHCQIGGSAFQGALHRAISAAISRTMCTTWAPEPAFRRVEQPGSSPSLPQPNPRPLAVLRHDDDAGGFKGSAICAAVRPPPP